MQSLLVTKLPIRNNSNSNANTNSQTPWSQIRPREPDTVPSRAMPGIQSTCRLVYRDRRKTKPPFVTAPRATHSLCACVFQFDQQPKDSGGIVLHSTAHRSDSSGTLDL
ncbi:hypothetical protein J6590_017608 [Homalodisca vitripennis]|nr:hypothetical protein J6590_017608 [Homalodisca vitripennis]